MLFAENLVNNVLLPAPHQHLVFTIPKRIRPYFKFDRSNLQLLYSAAWLSVKSLVLELYPDATPAAVLALHSAGELLNWHPHLHGIFLSEALRPDGTFTPLNLDPAQITARFAKSVLNALLNEELLTQVVIDNLLSWEQFLLRQGYGGKAGFNVYLGDPIPHTDTNQLLFVARYLRKCPVSNERITLRSPDQNCQVVYHSYKNNKHESRSFSPLEFLAELSCHIPDVWQQTTRFYGLYSCRTRGAQKITVTGPQQQPNILLGPPPEPLKPSSASRARCMK